MGIYSFRVAQQQIIEASKLLNLDQATLELLSTPRLKQVLHYRKNGYGEVKIFQAYRIQYNLPVVRQRWNKISILKKPLNNKSTSLLDDMETAVVDLPLGGGKGGVCCDPTTMSEREFRKIIARICSCNSPLLGVDIDIPAPDVYTNPQTMTG